MGTEMAKPEGGAAPEHRHACHHHEHDDANSRVNAQAWRAFDHWTETSAADLYTAARETPIV